MRVSSPDESEPGPSLEAEPEPSQLAWPSPSERVSRALDEDTRNAFGHHFLMSLQEGLREIHASLRRCTLGFTLLVTAFLLLKGTRETQFSLGPLKVTNVNTVLTLIPPLVAALAYEYYALVAAQAVYRVVLGRVVKVMFPPIWENDLEYLLGPTTVLPLGSTSGTWESLRATAPGFSRRFLDGSTVFLTLLVLVGGIGFLAYAFYYLFTAHNTNTLAVTISLAITVFFGARGVALVSDTLDQTPELN